MNFSENRTWSIGSMTAIIAAAMDAVAANGVGSIDITPLDFMLGLMADKAVDPNLRFKAAARSRRS
jgi:hypothetical protein